MAPKRPSVLDNPPSASPFLEEEDSEEISDPELPQNPNSEEVEEEERETAPGENPADSGRSDSDTDSDPIVSLLHSRKIKKAAQKSVSKWVLDQKKPSATNGSESDSETESADTASDFTVKPNSKPIPDSPKSKKTQNSASKSASKQALDDSKSDKNEAQKKGKPSSNGGGALNQKKSPIVRLWFEDGELTVLKGMLEFKSKKGTDPLADTNIFYEFVKKLLPIEVSKNQLVDKIRRLKKKYETNVSKGEVFFSKPHDTKSFELMKKIWGSGVVVESGAKNGKRKEKSGEDLVVERESNGEKSNKKAKKDKPLEAVREKEKEVVEREVGLEVDEVRFWDNYPRFKEALEDENYGYHLKEFSKIGDMKAKEMEKKWKLYQAKEVELKLLKYDLVKEQAKMLHDELMKE